MPVVTDPAGVQWTVRRVRWPFPSVAGLLDTVDVVGWVIGLALLGPFLALWPFWRLSKLLGARWVVIIERSGVERDGVEVARERIRGRRRADGRIAELLLELSQGWRSGHITL